MRNEEFSRLELRESHATIQELASPIQESHERLNQVNDSRKFQDVESICSGTLSPRSQSAGKHSMSLCYAEPRPKFAT